MDFFLLFQSLNAFAMMKLSAMWPLDHTYSIVFSLCCAGLLSAAAVIMKRADEMRMLKQFLKPNFKKTQMKTVYFILMDKLMQSNGSD